MYIIKANIINDGISELKTLAYNESLRGYPYWVKGGEKNICYFNSPQGAKQFWSEYKDWMCSNFLIEEESVGVYEVHLTKVLSLRTCLDDKKKLLKKKLNI